MFENLQKDEMALLLVLTYGIFLSLVVVFFTIGVAQIISAFVVGVLLGAGLMEIISAKCKKE